MSIIYLRSKYAHAGIHIFLVVDNSKKAEEKSGDTEEITTETATEEPDDKQETQPADDDEVDKDTKEGEDVRIEEDEANADTKDTIKSVTGV